MDIFKNPILIGLTMGAITYAYLTHTVNERNEQNEKRKTKITEMIYNMYF